MANAMTGLGDTINANIMIVDDDPGIVKQLTKLLTKNGYRVNSSMSSATALQAVKSEPTDLVLLDIDLPEMDGFEVCRQLKAEPATSTIPVIFISGILDTDSKVKGFEVGGLDYITKPYSSKEILARINTQLQLNKLQHQLEEMVVERTSVVEAERGRLQKVFELAPNAFFILDIRGKIKDVNRQACLSLGYSRDELLRLNIKELRTGISKNKINDIVRSVTKGQHTIVEGYHQRKDGSIFPVEISVGVFEERDPSLFLAIVRDISELKQTEQSLLASRRRYRTIFNDSPVPLWEEDFSDLCGYLEEIKSKGVNDFRAYFDSNPNEVEKCSKLVQIVDVNSAVLKLHNVKNKEELLGNLDKVFTENSYRAFKEELIAIAAGKTTFATEAEVKTLTGEPRYVALKLKINNEQPNALTALLATIDITDRRREEKVKSAQLRLVEFAVSHSNKELLQRFLDEAEWITGSSIGFFHYYNQDLEELSLQAWSTNTLTNMCSVEVEGLHYPLADAGVWCDCVRQGKPVIHNDYASLLNRKGMPDGHAPVIRELVVPVFRSDKIVAVLGVGNKQTDYDESDVFSIQSLADMAWETVFRKQAETALQESEEKLKSIFRAVPVAICVVVDRVFMEANEQVFELTGYTKDELIGKDARILYVSDEDYQLVGNTLDRQIEEHGVAVTESSMKKKDGRIVEVMIRATKLDPADPSAGYTITLLDITERNRAIVELSLQSAALQAAANAIVITDANQIIQWSNPAFSKLTGFSTEEILGRKPNILKSGFHDEAFYNDIRETISAGEIWNGEIINRHKGGSLYTEEMTITPLKASNGAISHYIAIKQDITDRKLAEKQILQYSENLENMVKERTEKLKEAQQTLIKQEKLAAIGKLSGSVAHDIRNPLGAISNSIYYLNAVTNKETDGRIRKHLTIMEREIDRVKEIINDLMDFSRENTPNFSKGDLNHLLQQVVADIDLPSEIELDIQLETNLPIIAFDYSLLHRVFVNLINNAVQAMIDGGTIKVHTRYDEEFVMISIGDTGYGIPQKDIDKIFEPLFTTKAKGVGLGLSIVKDFVEKHNGSVEVESTVGEGTTFYIIFPVDGKMA